MKIEIPETLAPRLRAHASRLGLSPDGVAQLLLGGSLPLELERDVVRWVDARIGHETNDTLVTAGRERLKQRLHPLPITRPQPVPITVPRRFSDRGVGIFHDLALNVTRSATRFECGPVSWCSYAPVGLRLRVLRSDEGTRIHARGPYVRHGERVELIQIDAAIEDERVYLLRGPLTVVSPQRIELELWTDGGEATVYAELLCELLTDDAYGAHGAPYAWTRSGFQIEASDDRVESVRDPADGWELAYPGWTRVSGDIRVPMHCDGKLATPVRAHELVHWETVSLPWVMWRLVSIVVDAGAQDARWLYLDDYRVGGGANLFMSELGLHWRSLAADLAVRPALRAYPIVAPPNTAIATSANVCERDPDREIATPSANAVNLGADDVNAVSVTAIGELLAVRNNVTPSPELLSAWSEGRRLDLLRPDGEDDAW